MASAALPFIFPTVRINRQHYIDGGLRLNTPMSPAIQLGAQKLLVIGMHHESEKVDTPGHELFTNIEAPPSLGNMIGKVLNSIFLDKLDYDIEQMTRINRLVEWGEGCYGADFVQRINEYLLRNGIRGDIANRGLKKLEVLKIFPSKDIRDIFSDATDQGRAFVKSLAKSEKFLLKLLDVDLITSKDFLSFIIFYPKYIQMLLDLGFEDARSHHDKLVEFLSP
jgi:NTE family protein